METLQFDESQFKLRSRRILGEPEVPGMIKILVTKGVVKTEKQAILFLLATVAIFIVLSVFIVKSNSVQPASLDAEYLSLK